MMKEKFMGKKYVQEQGDNMNTNVGEVNFFEKLEQNIRILASHQPVEGYSSVKELFEACKAWVGLENGPFRSNGYKEYFNNIVANLKHENSQHLAIAVFIKAHNLNSVQIFLLLRLLVKTALGPCTWDSRMKTYLERGQVLFSEKELESLFSGLKGNEIKAVGNIFEYSRRCINLNRCFVYVKQFLGVLPPSNEVCQ